MTRCLLLLAPFLLVSSSTAFAFTPCTHHVFKSKSCRRTTVSGTGSSTAKLYPALNNVASPLSTTTLGASSVAAVARSTLTAVFSQLRKHAKILILLLTATVLFAKRSNPQTLLWPGTETDQDCDAPLPDGGYGCPFIGFNFMHGQKNYGPFAKLFELGQKYGKIYRLYGFGMPIVSVSGKENVKSLLSNEFKKEGGVVTSIGGFENVGKVFGDKALLYENDAKHHAKLRKLAGQAMTPGAIDAALPSIQELANQQIDKVLKSDTMKMETVFNDFALDIARKQILGLDLKEEDVPEFQKQIKIWIKCIFDPILMLPFPIPVSITKSGRARSYIVSKIEEKLNTLDRDGPDSSSLSKMYFAEDDDGSKLTREEVIDNACLLIFAGSETSATTLMVATLFLGLHPNVWRKVKAEQDQLVAEYGEEFTRDTLDKSVYLDAVIKETLRIKPVGIGEMRLVEDTVVVDGKQIPKNWFGVYNNMQTHFNDPKTFKEDGSHMDGRKGFQPERWFDDATKPDEWMPFGEGGRRCLGERLGMAEMKVFLGMMARKIDRYDLVNVQNDDSIAWTTNTVMARPADGTEIRATAADTTAAVEYMI